MRLQEAQRDHRAVIERRIASAQRPRIESSFACDGRERLGERRVVLSANFDLGCAELREASCAFVARRDMEIVGVHDGVRTRDDDRIRLEGSRLLHRPFISVYRQLNLAFLALADFRQNDRRMRYSISS